MTTSDKKFNVLDFIETHLVNPKELMLKFKSYQEQYHIGKPSMMLFLRDFNLSEKNIRAVIDEYNFQNPRQNIPYFSVQEEYIDPELIEKIRNKETYPEFLWPYLYPELRDISLGTALRNIESLFLRGRGPQGRDELCKLLIAKLDFLTLDDKNKSILYFDSKIWNYGGKILLERILEKTIPNATSYHVRECIDKIRRLTPLPNTSELLDSENQGGF